MAEVKVLVKGFLSESNLDGACGTTSCLIKDKNKIIISDPGIGDQKNIIKALKKEGLTTTDINYIFITHSHLDHYRNIGMFPRAKSIDFWGIWNTNGSIIDLPKKFSKDIEIIKTPGHDYTSLTMIVNTNKRMVAVCGDVFWKKNYPENDPYANSTKELKKSRALVLKLADYIIPGHGEMFKVEK